MPGLLISDLLMASGLLTPEKLEQAQRLVQQKRCSLDQAILDLQLASKSELYGTISDQLRVPYVELDEYETDPKVRELIPEDAARHHRVFPLFRLQNTLIVAMSDPTDLVAMDAIRKTSRCLVEAYISSEQEISRAIDQGYGTRGETEHFLEELARESQKAEGVPSGKEEAPVTKLVDLILTQAIRDRASDIHIEPEEEAVRIRLRIDGVLHEIPSPPKSLEPALISRLKVLANLDIAENRAPQDGHFQWRLEDRRIDFRVSTLPTLHGENVVLRILDSSGVFLGLEKSGFSPEIIRKIEEILQRPHGIILCVGPTGSGKTTTLYAAMMRINSMVRNIITIEDPVEYRVSLLRQVQVNPKAGVTFATGLRSILRQDPDVVMVGEIRDAETASIAIQSALTGHLVLSTLHTNDAPSTITRLINMGIEPFLVSASLICIMAQRLVRLICESCKVWYDPSPALLRRLKLQSSADAPLKMAKGAGCPQCKGTGFRGRSAIVEMMVLDDELRELIISNPSVGKLREAACAKGMRLLWEEGMAKVLAGATTVEEVLRVAELQA